MLIGSAERVDESLLKILCRPILACEDILVVYGTGVEDGALQRDGVSMVDMRHHPRRLMAARHGIVGVGDLTVITIPSRACHDS